MYGELKDFLGIVSIIFDESNDNLGMGPDKIFYSLLSGRCHHIWWTDHWDAAPPRTRDQGPCDTTEAPCNTTCLRSQKCCQHQTLPEMIGNPNLWSGKTLSIVFTASQSLVRQCVLLVKIMLRQIFGKDTKSWPDLDLNNCEWCQPFYFSSQLCVYGIRKRTISYFGQTVCCVKFNYMQTCATIAPGHNIT